MMGIVGIFKKAAKKDKAIRELYPLKLAFIEQNIADMIDISDEECSYKIEKNRDLVFVSILFLYHVFAYRMALKYGNTDIEEIPRGSSEMVILKYSMEHYHQKDFLNSASVLKKFDIELEQNSNSDYIDTFKDAINNKIAELSTYDPTILVHYHNILAYSLNHVAGKIDGIYKAVSR